MFTQMKLSAGPRAMAFAALLCVSGTALGSHFGTIEMKYVGVGLGGNVKIDVDGKASNVFAGEIMFQTRNATGDAAEFGAMTLPAFCVEPTQYVQSGWKSYTLTDAESAATPMMSAARASALRSALSLFVDEKAVGKITAAAATGFQIAAWEIMRDFDGGVGRASLDLTGGTFKVSATSGAALSDAVNNWATQFFDAAQSSYKSASGFVFSSASSQDQIVPSPGSMMLFCAGFWAVSRRSRTDEASNRLGRDA